MTNVTKLLVMMMCFITMEAGLCKTPWSGRDRRLYLRTAEELDQALSKLAEYKRKEQELIDLQQEELLKDEPMYIQEDTGKQMECGTGDRMVRYFGEVTNVSIQKEY